MYKSPDSEDFDIPENFSIIQLTEIIGYGFCGKVFKWRYSEMIAAVKVCDAHKNRDGVLALQNEARVYKILTDIQGKYIPKLLFYGEAWGYYFLATNFIEGFHPDQIEDTMPRLSGILKELRKRRVNHGDIKAGNVIVKPNGEVCLIDFSHASI